MREILLRIVLFLCRITQFRYRSTRYDRGMCSPGFFSSSLLHEDFFLIILVRIVEDYAHQEAVELSLRKWICTFVLQRILCSKYYKRWRKCECLIAYRNSFFFHSLEECGLYLGRSAIDLICEEYTCEYRSPTYFECSLPLTVYLTACEIRWEEIGGKRYATSIQSEHTCKSPNRLGLTDSRYSFEECMSSCEECDNELLDESILTDDISLNTWLDSVECIVDVGESWIQNNSKLKIKNSKLRNPGKSTKRIWKKVIFAKKKNPT